MPLLSGDIRFARSANMADVPEGGGPPSAQLMTSGRSNEIFPDLSEETHTVGRVEIYQVFGILRNTDRAALMGSNVILAEPPADPNVSVTLLSLKNPFATRAEIARRIESGMAAGSEWSGYLLENHYATMRSIQVLQRPGMQPPTLGKTYVLVYQEGQSGERRQRVRIKSATTEVRIFTQVINGALTDFEAQVATCELFDALLYDFPGSTASRYYARDPAKTMIRETIYSDAGMFYSASRLTAATLVTDTWLQVASVYTQVVPNSRTEAAVVDQRPTSRRAVVLAEAPRRVEVGITPHTQRFKIDEVNAALTYVFQCQPLPAPGTIFIDFWALGQRYTLTDDGQGKIEGAGAGAVSYLTGAMSVTLKAVPDIGSMITLSHGASVAYTNRSSQGAAVRAPEYTWTIEGDDGTSAPADAVVPGSLQITYASGGVVRTVTDNGAGKLGGAGTGVIDYPSRSVVLRPAYMPDPGAELLVECALDRPGMDILTAPAPDAGGFVALTLTRQPAAGTLSIQWAVARTVSNTSGGQLTTTSAAKTAEVTYSIRSVPEYYVPEVLDPPTPDEVAEVASDPPASAPVFIDTGLDYGDNYQAWLSSNWVNGINVLANPFPPAWPHHS